MKVYYVEFIVFDGVMEEHRIQPVRASSETEALEGIKEDFEKGILEVGDTYKILGIKHVED